MMSSSGSSCDACFEQWYGDLERDRVYLCAGQLELRLCLAYYLHCNDASVDPRCAHGVADHTEQLGNGAYGIGDGVSAAGRGSDAQKLMHPIVAERRAQGDIS
jgi:hypothetical protein